MSATTNRRVSLGYAGSASRLPNGRGVIEPSRTGPTVVRRSVHDEILGMSPSPDTGHGGRRLCVYLAGPISGYPIDERIETFRNKQVMLEQAGFEVVNPCELSPPGKNWNLSLRTDIAAMMGCDTIYLQRGWAKSKGVQLELHIALALEFDVMVEGETA